jgi:hypothetical protein
MTGYDIEFAQRLTRMETRMETFEVTQKETNSKLDELIGLKNKGAGVFLASSALFGIILTLALQVFKGWFHG